MLKLKEYSVSRNLLSEKFTNWNILFEETENLIINYIVKVGKVHNFNYLEQTEPFEHLPSDCYNSILFDVINLWYPFYYELERFYTINIETDISNILFDFFKK